MFRPNLDTFPRTMSSTACNYCGFWLAFDEQTPRACGYLCRVCVGRVAPEDAQRLPDAPLIIEDEPVPSGYADAGMGAER